MNEQQKHNMSDSTKIEELKHLQGARRKATHAGKRRLTPHVDAPLCERQLRRAKGDSLKPNPQYDALPG